MTGFEIKRGMLKRVDLTRRQEWRVFCGTESYELDDLLPEEYEFHHGNVVEFVIIKGKASLIRPIDVDISIWKTLSRRAHEEGYTTLTQFIAWLEMHKIKPDKLPEDILI